MNKIESFLEYSNHDRRLRKYSLTCRIKSLLTWKNILPHEQSLWMKVWIEKKCLFYFECWQETLFLRKFEQKKQGQNNLCLFISKQFDKCNVQFTLQGHTLYFLNMKYIQAL
jgi:hypothetical protein